MKLKRETDADISLLRRAGMILAAALVVWAAVVVVLLRLGIVRWEEVVGFIDWFSRATAFGAIFAGIFALTAAWLGYHGVRQTILATEVREREMARHERYTTIVTQLASQQPTVRLGGLFAVSALADEWEREARRLVSESPWARQWKDAEKTWASAVDDFAVARRDEARRAASGIFDSEDVMHDWLKSRRRHFAPQENLPKQAGPRGRNWIRVMQVVEAEFELTSARASYILTRTTAPPPARDAIAHRDSCLELVTAYLRSDFSSRLEAPAPQKTPVGRETGAAGEVGVRDAALSIIRHHTAIEAPYPWPSQQIDLSHAHLEGTDLSSMNLEGADLSEAFLVDANLNGANLQDTELRQAHLKGARLRRANLTRASLWRTDARGANLWKARLYGAQLSQADLGGAYLSRAELPKATMRSTILAGADLSMANLSNAETGRAAVGDQMVLADVTDEEGLRIVRWNERTQWPTGFDPDLVLERQCAVAETRLHAAENLSREGGEAAL